MSLSTQIGEDIYEKGINLDLPLKRRNTARAIILNPERTEILLVYSPFYDDYTFPGGGVKQDEELTDALQRELQEEIGATEIKVESCLGYTIEHQIGINPRKKHGYIFWQKSYFFFTEVLAWGEQSLEVHEKAHGVKPTWIKLEDVLAYNGQRIGKGFHALPGMRTVLSREQLVLEEVIKCVGSLTSKNTPS
jgi:8-oxo-dGTP pyrophosphatase MutT (NUDIX family)